MRELGIAGAVWGRRVITTVADPAAERAPALIDRDFMTDALNRTRVDDLRPPRGGSVNFFGVVSPG